MFHALWLVKQLKQLLAHLAAKLENGDDAGYDYDGKGEFEDFRWIVRFGEHEL
jgi:hypothetical protein